LKGPLGWGGGGGGVKIEGKKKHWERDVSKLLSDCKEGNCVI
jgi:hypothetical protein